MSLPAVFEGLDEADAETTEFELRDPEDSDDDVIAWLGALPDDGSRVTVFAQDGTGGLYAIWQRSADEALDAAPVVLLGSEGDVRAIARDAAAFLEAHASGKTIGPFDGAWYDELDHEDDPDLRADELARRERFATWARGRLGLASFRPPEQISAVVAALDAALEAWVAAHNAHG